MRATASYPPTSPQDQYVFIHDALNDFLTCGDTSVPAHELRRTISTMSQTEGDEETGFQRQFEVGQSYVQFMVTRVMTSQYMQYMELCLLVILLAGNCHIGNNVYYFRMKCTIICGETCLRRSLC